MSKRTGKQSNSGQFSSGQANGVSWNPIVIMRELLVAWRLLWDPQVSTLLKLFLPVLALVYWISPIDLMPGMPFDDLAVVIVASRIFVNMAPADAVQRAMSHMAGGSAGGSQSSPDDDVIDTSWRVVDK